MEFIKREYGLGIEMVHNETQNSCGKEKIVDEEYREDTIKTDKIEQIIEEDMKNQSRFMKMGSGLNGSIDEEKGLNGAYSTNDIKDINKNSKVFNSVKNSIDGEIGEPLSHNLIKNSNEMR